MNTKELKQLRGQIRQIVKDLLPEILSAELMATIQNQLQAQLSSRLNLIDDRQKDLQSYMIRATTPKIEVK